MTSPQLPIPCYDRVLVRQRQAEEKKGALYIPAVAAEVPNEGQVLAVGRGPIHVESPSAPPFRVGDWVMFGKYSGTDVTFEGETLKLLQFSEVLAVLPEAS